MKRVLITGANGFIGRALLNRLVADHSYDLFATSYQDDQYSGSGYSFYKLDLTSKADTHQLIESIRPHFIINTAALSSIPECEGNPDKAYAINVKAVDHLVGGAKTCNSMLIQLSTDFVFDGLKNTPYNELTPTNPINCYGQTKELAEKLILQSLTRYAIVRVEVVYGTSLVGQHSNIVEIIYKNLKQNKTTTLVNDQFRTPTYVGDVCDGLLSIIQKEYCGIFHLAGPTVYSIYELGINIARYYKKDLSLIQPITSDLTKYKRPLYTPLEITKAQDLFGYKPLSLELYLSLLDFIE